MATFTKTQFEKRIEDLKEKISGLKEELGEVQDALEELQGDLESESSDIEPYEGKSDLTPAQEETATVKISRLKATHLYGY